MDFFDRVLLLGVGVLISTTVALALEKLREHQRAVLERRTMKNKLRLLCLALEDGIANKDAEHAKSVLSDVYNSIGHLAPDDPHVEYYLKLYRITMFLKNSGYDSNPIRRETDTTMLAKIRTALDPERLSKVSSPDSDASQKHWWQKLPRR